MANPICRACGAAVAAGNEAAQPGKRPAGKRANEAQPGRQQPDNRANAARDLRVLRLFRPMEFLSRRSATRARALRMVCRSNRGPRNS